MSDWSKINTSEWDEEPLDPELVLICGALNEAGFVTTTSCSGHGYQRPCIWFEHSTDERIESMARFILAAQEHDYPEHTSRIRKQVHIEGYSWSIDVWTWGVDGSTPSDISLKRAEQSLASVAQLINAWHKAETRKLSI